jgi:hypothetical protein
MLESAVYVMFVSSCVLLAALFFRKDIFLISGWKSASFISTPSQRSNESNIVSQSCDDSYKKNLELSSSQWDPILVNFLVNQKSVNVALATTDHLYLQLKALEFCTENAAVLNLQSLEQLESDCALPLVSVLHSKVKSGDFLRPVRRKEPVVENSPVEATNEVTRDAPSVGTDNAVSSDSLTDSIVTEYHVDGTIVPETAHSDSNTSEPSTEEFPHIAQDPSAREELEPPVVESDGSEADKETVDQFVVDEVDGFKTDTVIAAENGAEVPGETVDQISAEEGSDFKTDTVIAAENGAEVPGETVDQIAAEEGNDFKTDTIIVAENGAEVSGAINLETVSTSATSGIEDGLKLRVEEIENLQFDSSESLFEVDESGEVLSQ